MSIRQLLDLDDGSTNYGKIDAAYIPSSVHPTYSATPATVDFSFDAAEGGTPPDGVASQKDIVAKSNFPVINANFNFAASSYAVSLYIYMNITSPNAGVNSNLNQNPHPLGISITINGQELLYSNKLDPVKVYPIFSILPPDSTQAAYQVTFNDRLAGPFPVLAGGYPAGSIQIVFTGTLNADLANAVSGGNGYARLIIEPCL